MNYFEVKIFTTTEGLEPVSGILTIQGYDTFATEDSTLVDELLEKKLGYEWDFISDDVLDMKKKESVISLYMEDSENSMNAILRIKSAINDLKKSDAEGNYGRLAVESRLVSDDDWKDRWKEYFKPALITDTIVVKPSWESYEAREGEKIIEIDPGMAFGTGTHPTTKMCVKLLEKYIDSPKDSVLDLGCGSGILSIASVLCGSENVTGVDIDPEAVKASLENVGKNAMSDKIRILEGDITKGLGFTADIVAANLIADLVIMMGRDVSKHLSGKKIFISSGILTEQEEKVASALKEEGYNILEITEEGEWCAIAAAYAG